jgi:hypothetical protein
MLTLARLLLLAPQQNVFANQDHPISYDSLKLDHDGFRGGGCSEVSLQHSPIDPNICMNAIDQQSNRVTRRYEGIRISTLCFQSYSLSLIRQFCS